MEGAEVRGNADVHQPDLAAGVIVQERFHIHAGDEARPDDFGAVDLSGVENPFFVDVVISGVTDDHQVLAGSGIKLIDNVGAVPVVCEVEADRTLGLGELLGGADRQHAAREDN